MKNYRIIDSHCHIYPDKIAARAVESISRFYDGMPLKWDGTCDTLVRTGNEAGISHFIVQSVATTPEHVHSINRFIAESVAKSGGCMTGLGSMHPDSPDYAADLDELQALGLRGVKLHPDIQRFEMDDPRCMKIYELCEARGLPILMHTGDHRYDYSNPNRLIRVLREFPKLIIIGAHMGGWSVWDEAARTVAKFPNLYMDVSSSLYALSPAHAREIVEAYGVDHTLYGTDYPMWDQKDEIDRTLAMGFTEAEYERIFARNTEELFGLTL